MKQHPLSAIFPALSESEFDALAADIKQNGVRNAIVTFENQVLDGWHRYRASLKVNVICRQIEYKGKDPAGFVASHNLHRRNLNASQRAFAVVQLAEWHPGGIAKQWVAPGATGPVGATNEEMKTIAGTSERTIVQAKRVEEVGSDELKEAVKSGDVSLKAAYAKVNPSRKKKDANPKPPATKAKAEKPADAKAAAPAEIEALRAEIADLKERLAEMVSEFKSAIEDNESMARVLEADDKVTAALAEAKRYREQYRILNERFTGVTNERNQYIKDVKHWKKKAEAKK